MKNLWTTLFAPIVVALIVGYFLRDIQQPDRASVLAEINWIDTANPFSSLDLKKIYELTADVEPKDKILDTLSETADNFITVRIAAIKISNTSDMTSKNTEISFVGSGVLYWHDTDKVPHLNIRSVIASLAPGETRRFTAIMRPHYFEEAERGILITHDGRRIELTSTKAPEELIWIIPVFQNYPATVTLIAFLSLVSLLLFSCLVIAFLLTHQNVEWTAKNTSKKDAEQMVRVLDCIKEKYPEKLSGSDNP